MGCMFVCVYVYPNKKKFSTDLKNSFFPRKVWTPGVTWAILEVSNTTPSCRKPDKPSKNRVFLTSETDLLLDFDENWHKCIKDMPAPQNKKKYKREARRSGANRSECVICLV